MNKKTFLILLILIIFVGVVLTLTVFKKEKDHSVVYKKEAVDIGNISALVDTTGTLNPVTIVDVGSQVSGRILELHADFNSKVKKGQIISKIDPELFETKVNQLFANFQSSKASLDKSNVTLKNNKRKYERANNLFDKKLISFEDKETAETQYLSSLSDLQSAKARLEQARSQLNTSKVDLKNTVIRSPIDGIVINRNFNVGQTVAASFQAPVLFQIANDLSKMQVECSVDESDIGKVKKNQKVSFTVDAFPNDRFLGVVSQVRYSPEVISNVVTYTTIVEVDNPEMKLRPGMTATVSIVVGEAIKKLRILNSALRFNPNLSPEEMRAMFMNRGGGRPNQEKRENSSSNQTAEKKPSEKSGQFGNFMRSGSGSRSQRSQMRNIGRVWIEDEDGKLKMIFVRTGVTDNVRTEVTGGELKEGMMVITGENGGDSTTGSNRNNMMRGMRMMMR